MCYDSLFVAKTVVVLMSQQRGIQENSLPEHPSNRRHHEYTVICVLCSFVSNTVLCFESLLAKDSYISG